jgi:hypothetical protein
MNDKQDTESSNEQDSESTCLKSNEDDAEYALLRRLNALENILEAEKDSEAIIARANETVTRIEQIIEHAPMNIVVDEESNRI